MFPARPFDGMKFTDSWRRKWVYSSSNSSWQFNGFVPDIPIADRENIGLLSPKLKLLLDGIKAKSGSFGIIAKDSFGRVPKKDYSNVMSGNIKLVSNTLDITCNNQIPSPELDRYPSIDINFSERFLESLCIEVPGEQGVKGKKGEKGDKGDPGTGDGPQGAKGEPGQDVDGFSSVSEVEVVFDDAFYTSAVTDVFLSQENGILSVTKSDALVATEDTPASEVVAQSVQRDIEFEPDSFDFKVTKPIGVADPFDMALDFNVLAYGADFDPKENKRFKVAATGCCCEEADSAEVIAVNFSDYVKLVIQKYQDSLNQINDEYDKEVKEYIFKKDEEARKALDVLVQKLSDENFKDSFEYCMNLANNGVCGQCVCNEISKMRQDLYLASRGIVGALVKIGAILVEKLGAMDAAAVSLISGQSDVASEIASGIADSFAVPTLSQNVVPLESPLDDICPSDNAKSCFTALPFGSDYNKFEAGICRFSLEVEQAEAIYNPGFDDDEDLDVSDPFDSYPFATAAYNGVFGFEGDGPSRDSKTTLLQNIRVAVGENELANLNTGPTLDPGYYILQYKGGTIYDSDYPTCGHFISNRPNRLGLIIKTSPSKSTSLSSLEEGIGDYYKFNKIYGFMWPESSILKNPLDQEEVEQSYLLGPINESAIGINLPFGGRILVDIITEGENSYGEIELSLFHCDNCLQFDSDGNEYFSGIPRSVS